jgi:16S rRNA (uracil1498-N3)-methyltransferase
MAIKSVYLPSPEIEAASIRITGDEHRHLSVARVETGEAVEVFDGKGNVWLAEVASRDRHTTWATVTAARRVEPEPFELIAAISLVRQAAFELAVEKVVEVGVTRILPIIAERSNVRAAKRDGRLLRLVVEAAKQSKRYHIPRLEDPVRCDRLLDYPARTKIVFAERGGGPLKSAVDGSPALYAVGPEGGWTDGELLAFAEAGFKRVGLGPYILKTETAAIAGGALLHQELAG